MADLHPLSVDQHTLKLQLAAGSDEFFKFSLAGIQERPVGSDQSLCLSLFLCLSLSYALHGEVSPIKWPSGPIQRDQYFVHIPVGQALSLIQADTPAARSFVWLKDSWGHTPIRVCSGQDAPHRPRRPGCVNG